MTMLNHLGEFAQSARAAWMPVTPCYAVRLIDRATGMAHCIADIPLVIYSRDPQQAAAELLRNRDPERWMTHIEPVRKVRSVRS
ncbi:hypothetical protein MLD63_00505 (plasmid) [Paracoccus sp. TK19116]|uniref:Uncharacterized protein n=1 Tax=Paracoccus albicereus TaxID=2922394 RepID=A0ABT1MKU6_9RHOB|nr:hypothetical protein [Paracoccus albicereus]MCQ0968917.1 hypothetical protein [Paracoccus albicereus]